MSEMVYSEFLEVLGRLAAAKFPETDTTLAQKVDKLFQHSECPSRVRVVR